MIQILVYSCVLCSAVLDVNIHPLSKLVLLFWVMGALELIPAVTA